MLGKLSCALASDLFWTKVNVSQILCCEQSPVVFRWVMTYLAMDTLTL